jgi:hypothetical protein
MAQFLSRERGAALERERLAYFVLRPFFPVRQKFLL